MAKFQRAVNRIPPKMGPASYDTYSIHVPMATHWRPAECLEVRCPHHEFGWKTVVDERTTLGEKQAYYIRHNSGRSFHEFKEMDGLTSFLFEPGQRCFREHRIKTGRPELYSVKRGDHRATIGDVRRMRSDDWVDKFAEHQYQLKVQQEKG